jgi:hypothetical protein
MTILDPVPRPGHAGHNAGGPPQRPRDVIAEAGLTLNRKRQHSSPARRPLHTNVFGAKEIVAIAAVIPQSDTGAPPPDRGL